MNFLADAHISPLVCAMLARNGHSATHTSDLPAGNATKDGFINQRSEDEQQVVISKDTYFFYSHMLHRRPWKLLLVTTGNISRHDLVDLIERHLPEIIRALTSHTLVEIDRSTVTPIK